MNRIEKENFVSELTEQFSNSKIIYVSDYKGLDVETITDLRKQLRTESSEFHVVKNTLVRIAAKKAGYDGMLEHLAGPIALTWHESDPVGPAKVLSRFSKDKGLPTIKVGFVEGKLITSNEVKKIGNLPSREELLTKLVVGLKSPITGMVFSLKGILNNFARVINAIAEEKKKSS